MQRNDFVKNTYVNIANKLPLGLVELYADISKHAQELGIDYLVVGAMARDLVLVHGFDSKIERGTRDVDFGINVASWDEFDTLKSSLLGAGYKATIHKAHQLNYVDKEGSNWEIDIVPFGAIADAENNIYWPPKQDFVMNVLGFPEALENSLDVQIQDKPEIIISVASPVGVCLLKVISWLDRNIELRPKDATDFIYLIESYCKIPEIYDALYDQGYMETQEWDQDKASAMKLGNDVGEIASIDTKAFLETTLFNHEAKREEFVRDMERDTYKSLSQCSELFDIFTDAFSNDDD